MKLRCIQSDDCGLYEYGNIYEVDSKGNTTHHYKVITGDDYWFIDKETLSGPGVGDMIDPLFEIVTEENTQNGSEDTQDEYVCTEGEEEIFKNIEQKQQPGILAKDHVHIGWTQEETTAPQESVDCSVAVVHHIYELQKWLKHIGCSSEAELRITSDHVWVSPQDFVSYEAKEGGVGTMIEYLRIVGAQQKCLEKMEEV